MAEKGKNDVFVGNLTFNTTEDHLREKFSFVGLVLLHRYLVTRLTSSYYRLYVPQHCIVGPVKSIRILTDKETGKPKGFAFVEYFDTNAALSAIKHLDQTELNGRKIKVGYPAQRLVYRLLS